MGSGSGPALAARTLSRSRRPVSPSRRPYPVQHDANHVRARGADFGQAVFEALEVELPGVDHEHDGICLGHEDRRLGDTHDRGAVQDDRPVRLAQRTQEPRHVSGRYVGGMPGRDTGWDQLEVAVPVAAQELGRPVGHGDVAHARRELDVEDLVQCRLPKVPVDGDDELTRGGERPRRVRRPPWTFLPAGRTR